MTTFENREKAFEAKFAHDQEMNFLAAARTNRRLGLWAAKLLGKSKAKSKAYALDVVMADIAKPGHDDVCGKVAADLGDLADMKTVTEKRAELDAKVKGKILDAQ